MGVKFALEDKILTVAEFTSRTKKLLEENFPAIRLRGEISNLRIPNSGHAYFTLKDSAAQIEAVAFRGVLARSSLKLRDGMQVVLSGKITVYPQRGNYQIVVNNFEEEGIGRLQAEFERLRQKLAAEGLFDASAKQALPKFPRTIAFITSPTGAAIQDFISILRRRNWKGTLYVVPTKVQGIGAAEEIAAQIERVSRLKNLDLLVVGRGGGSLEDLWCFNEECVARAIHTTNVPVISAVGHEIDFTLSDFAADWRAETPSAAAEKISTLYLEIIEKFDDAQSCLISTVETQIQGYTQHLDLLEARLDKLSPKSYLERSRGQLQNLQHRLNAVYLQSFPPLKDSLNKINMRLENAVERRLQEQRERFLKLDYGLKSAKPERQILFLKEKLEHLSARISAVGIEPTLRRGFAIVEDEASGKLIESSQGISLGQTIRLKFHDGNTRAQGLELKA